MERIYLSKIFNKVLKRTLLWVVFCALLEFFLSKAVSLTHVFVWGVIFAVTLEAIVPFVHEWCHKVAYKLVHSDATISIHLGKGMWYVLDESDYQYSKRQMVFILVAPILVSIVPLFIFFIVSHSLLQALCLIIIVLNLLGMIGTKTQKGDIQYVMEMVKEKKQTYKFIKNAHLLKF